MWVGWLVPYIERIVKGLVNPMLHSVKPSFLSTLSIEEFNLGKRSPYIKSLRCYDGNREDMILEWDLDLCTKDMRIVLGATLGGKHLGLPIRVYVTDLHVIGPLRMGFKWMPVAPHLKHMTISFLSVPEAKVKVKPVSKTGIDVTEIPGLQGWIDGLVKDGLQVRFPARSVIKTHETTRCMTRLKLIASIHPCIARLVALSPTARLGQ